MDRDIEAGDVVQIDPDHDERFGGCFMLVEEVAGWGFKGFVEVPARGAAYYRAPTDSVKLVGKAPWLPGGTP